MHEILKEILSILDDLNEEVDSMNRYGAGKYQNISSRINMVRRSLKSFEVSATDA